ncbi:MAG: DUF433 domain-containing protein [Thermoleophilia bacterium]|nr:DUF433 domain-containing protein [Thermoleophilia bacterium]
MWAPPACCAWALPCDGITLDPKVMGGKPCIKGTRVTVGIVVGLVAAGRTIDEVLDAYPYLAREDQHRLARCVLMTGD